MKILGNKFLFGGTKGYIAIGYVGKAASCTDGTSNQALYLSTIGDSSSVKTTRTYKSQNYPHTIESAIVNSAVANVKDMFACADNNGFVSLWWSHTKFKKKFTYTPEEEEYEPRVEMVSIFDMSVSDASNIYVGEKIMTMKFLPDDCHLFIGSNKRMLLLEIKHSESSSVEDSTNNSTPKFTCWVEMDRVIPGTNGLFDFYVTESYVPTAPGAATAELQRKFVQWKICELSESVESPVKPKDKFLGRKTRCSLYRFLWTEEMFATVKANMKPI